AYGDHLPKDERYVRTGELMEVVRALLDGGAVDLAGRHVRVENARLHEPSVESPVPLYFGGASPEAEEVAARHAEVQLLWGEPPAAVAERVARVREKAARAGRALRFGIRLHVITRDTAAEAWREADRILAGFDPEAVRVSQERFARMDSTGQARMTALHGGSAEDLTVSPNLWAGIGLVREGAGTALVGSHDEVAQRLFEYGRAGIDEFVLSGYPHLEEAYRVGEEVAPRLRALTEAAGARADGAEGDSTETAAGEVAA
ncbi:LLM class flavin-dependent oxidoreductase, partial [Streptomyces sp. NPDC056295]